MLEKILFELMAVSIFIIIISKIVRKKDKSYISILIIELIGIIIGFAELGMKSKSSILLGVIRYICSIIIPTIIIIMELQGINFFEVANYGMAKILFAIGEEKKAKAILINIVTKYPDSYLSHKLLAKIYEKEGGMRKAIDEYVKLVDIKGKDYKSYFKIADLLNELGQKKEAIQMLENLMRSKPDSYEGAILLGSLLCEDQRYKEAEKVYQDALKHYPTDFDLYYNLGIVYTMLNEFQMAKNAYEMAAEINHKAYGANYNLGQIALIQGELDVAEQYFKESLYDELEAYSYFQLAKIYALKNEKTMAINFLNKAIEIEPNLLQKVNNEKIFDDIKEHISVSVKMDNNEKEENIEKQQLPKSSNILKIEVEAREYLEETNSLIRDMSENTERQIIEAKVDKIFKEKELMEQLRQMELEKEKNPFFRQKE